MFLKELNKNDYFILQQRGRCCKKIYTIRYNHNGYTVNKECYKTLKEAKAIFKQLLPDKVCYYHHFRYNRYDKLIVITDIITLE